MSGPLPPTVDELLLRIPDVDTDEPGVLDRLTAALDDATTLALAEVSTSRDTEWTANAPDLVHLVILTAARRGFENPRGINQETLGEHTVGMTATSGVYLSPRELAHIHRADHPTRPTSYTIKTPSPY